MLGLLLGASLAAYVTDIGAPLDADLPGRHGRPFYTDDGGRWLGFGRSGSFHVVGLRADGSATEGSFRTLVQGGGEFVDHTFVPCADGGFLHVASGNRTEPDDTAWVSFVGRDLSWRGTITLVDSDGFYTTNDMPALCSSAVWATGFATAGDLQALELAGNDLFLFGPSLFGGGGVPVTLAIPEALRMTGTSLVWHEDSRQILAIGLQPPDTLRVVTLDEELNMTNVAYRTLDLDGQDGYWAQSTAVVEGSFLVVHMVKGWDEPFSQDTGNVALTILGPELEVVETHFLTNFTPPSGAMRPAIAVSGDEVVVSFDVVGALHTVVARVDREGLAARRVTATADAALAHAGAAAKPSPADAAESNAASSACGLAAPPQLAGGLAVALLLLRRRER